MRYSKVLKLLSCLLCTFIFVFNNALFVQASEKYEETAQLKTKYEVNDEYIQFTGFITYTCINPYEDKRIVDVKDIQLYPDDAYEEKFSFEQQAYYYKVANSKREVSVVVCGKLIDTRDQGKVHYVQYIKIPITYVLEK